jgi:excisionase family DNA binding protein
VGTKGNATMDDRWLSLAEIAVYLGVSKDSVYRWLELRAMPAHKVGRQWKFKVAEVDAWVRNGKADFAPADVATKPRHPARTRKGR